MMLLYLKIKPNQRFDRLEFVAGQYQVRLKAPAIDGKANEHLIHFLAEITGLSRTKIRIKKGHSSRIKCMEIEADDETINNRLRQALKGLHNSL